MPLDNLTPGKGPVPLRAYVALVLVIFFFSGWFADSAGWYGFMDFNTLNGQFGKIGDATFVGKGGFGARYGFLFALSLIPGIMLALGVVAVAEREGALHAAQRILTPFLRPILGLPGVVGLALIGSLQSSDAGAVMTRQLREKHLLTDDESSIFGAFQFSSGGTIINYLTTGLALFPFLSVQYIKPLGVILLCKIVGSNMMRLYLHLAAGKKHGAAE
jgi:nucleoside recognition membrane protein YjiH